MSESVNVFESYTNYTHAGAKAVMSTIAQEVKDMTNELSVAYVVNNDMYFK